MGVKLKMVCQWGHMMEYFLVSEWVGSWGRPWEIAGKLWNGPYLGDVEGVLVGNFMVDPKWEI